MKKRIVLVLCTMLLIVSMTLVMACTGLGNGDDDTNDNGGFGDNGGNNDSGNGGGNNGGGNLPSTQLVDISQHLTYELNEDGNSYAVTGLTEEGYELAASKKNSIGIIVNTTRKYKLSVPSSYQDKPVTTIKGVNIETVEEKLTAFYSCTNIVEVLIPNTISSIGDYAFGKCSNLKIIHFEGIQEQWNAISKGVGWDDGMGEYIVNYIFRPLEMTMGTAKPTAVPVTAITDNSTATEMFYAAIDNFYGADYVSTYLKGNVETSIKGIKVNQLVIGNKVREGKGNAAGSKYFVDNRSYSLFAQVYEETYVDATGKAYIRNASGVKYNGGKDSTGKGLDGWTKKFKAAESFDTVSALVAAKVNDPTKIWMYDTDIEGAIKEISAVEKVEGKDQYMFSIVFDVDKVTQNYKAVMEYMLNQSVKTDGITFLGLKFDVVVWDNGYLADLYITEQYQVKIEGITNNVIELKSRQQYSYNPAEAGYTMAEKDTYCASWAK